MKNKRDSINYTRLPKELDTWFTKRSEITGHSKSRLLYIAARRFRDQVMRQEGMELLDVDVELLTLTEKHTTPQP